MELLVAFLLEKGGIFGFLFILSIIYIWWTGYKKDSKPKVQSPDAVQLPDAVHKDILDDIKSLNVRFLEIEKEIYDIHVKVFDLWNWHSVKDADGIPIWYVRRSIEESINSLSCTIRNDADRLSQHSKDISKVNAERVDELKDIITKYNKNILELTIALEKVRMTLETYRSQ